MKLNEFGIYIIQILYLHFDVSFLYSVFEIISDFSAGLRIEFADSVVGRTTLDTDVFPELESNE